MTTTAVALADTGAETTDAPPVYHARIYGMAQQKGGVGKTTSTVHLGGALAARGKKVLVVDFDPQGQLTVALGLKPRDDDADGPGPTLADALLGRFTGYADDLVTAHSSGMHVIRSSMDMFTLERELATVLNAEKRLARFLASFVEDYDYILIDCPPSLGLLTDMVILAATVTKGAHDDSGVVIITEAQPSIFLGLALLLGQVDQINDAFDITVRIVGLVINDYDLRNGNAVSAAFHKLTTHALGVLGRIPRRSTIPNAYTQGVTVHQLDPKSEAAKCYGALADTITGKVA